MPRSTRFCSHGVSEFVVESMSSDDTKLDSEQKKKNSSFTKKHRKRSKSERHISVLEQSSAEQPFVIIKKKRTKKRKSKDSVSEHAADERKIVRGRRRLHRHTNVDEDSSVTPIQLPQSVHRVSPPKTRLSLKHNKTSSDDTTGNDTLLSVDVSAKSRSPVVNKPMAVGIGSFRKSPATKISPKTRKSVKLTSNKIATEDLENNKTFDTSSSPQNIFSIVKKVKPTIASPSKISPPKTRKSLKGKAFGENKENDATFDKSLMSPQKVTSGGKSKSMSVSPLKPLPGLGKMSSPKTRLSVKNTIASSGDKETDIQCDMETLLQNTTNTSIKSSAKSSASPNKAVFNMDENLIETSVQKYSTRSLVTGTTNPFDLTLDASGDKSSEFLFRNTTNKNQSTPPKRGTFEILKPRVSRTQNTTNAFDEPLDTSSEDIESTQISEKESANKKNTFAGQIVGGNRKSKKSKTPARTFRKRSTKRDETFEVDPESLISDIKNNSLSPGRRGTFNVNSNGILSSSLKKSKVNLSLDSPEMSFTTQRLRSSKRDSLKKPTLVVRKSLSSMHRKKLDALQAQKKEETKIKISDSKTSLSESGISTPSSLLRRAQKLNPASGKASTPTTSHVKSSSTKKKPAQLSTSKVKKVPNYSAIHKKAYDKMEAIDDFLKRKATRSKALLSGQKPPAPVVDRLNSTRPGIRKKALFTNVLDVDNKFKPIIKFTDKATDSPVIFGNLNNMRPLKSGTNTRSSKNVDFSVKTPEPRVQPQRYAKTPIPTRDQIWNAYGTKIPRATAPSIASSAWVNSVGDGSVAPPLEFGKGTIGVDKKTRLKNVTSVSTKSKGSTTTIDSRRDHIKGVRSNRRFDLLMSMRK